MGSSMRGIIVGLLPLLCFDLLCPAVAFAISRQEHALSSSASCPTWCSRNKEAWKTKCSWTGCRRCAWCKRGNVRKPNILLIFADDVGQGDLPVYWGTSGVPMPNLDALAAKGTRFVDAHSTPLCAPARYQILSGNYVHRGQSPRGTWNLGDTNHFKEGQLSLASVLRQNANYHTAMFGKWHLGGRIPPNGSVAGVKDSQILTYEGYDWTLPLGGGPQDIGFDSSLVTVKGIQGPPYAFFRDGFLTTPVEDVVMWRTGSYEMPAGVSKIQHRGEGAPDWDSSAYNMILVQETIGFIDQHLASRRDDSFFVHLSLGSVHVPHSPPKRYLDRTRIAGQLPTEHMDLLFEMDKVVGSLVEALEERSLLRDTLVIFTSDNGGLSTSSSVGHDSSGPFRASKKSIYEGGHRVPLIFRWDRVFPQGETRSKLVGLHDLFATICNIAGIDVPRGQAVDSRDFANYILNDKATRLMREHMGIWRGEVEESIRKDEFKLIRVRATGVIELYNLAEDLSETTDLSTDPAYATLIEDMLHELGLIGPTQRCDASCARLGGSWDERCTKAKCRGCSECYSKCRRSWCSRQQEPWSQKCGWRDCRGCDKCTCQPRCSTNQEGWDVKCGWARCSRCAECST